MTMTDEKDKKSSENGEEKKKIEDVRATGAHTPDSKRTTSSNPPKKAPPKDEAKEDEEDEAPPPKKAAAKKEEKKEEKKKPAEAPRKPWVNFFPPRELPRHGPEIVVEKKPILMLAEFDSPGRALHAAERLRDAGYTKFDWIVLTGGLTGLATAVTMIYWMNGIDYPLIIGGKPPFSLPPSVPIMFELTILFSAFSALFGMLHLNRLPRHHHPIFESERFTECSDDKFFLSVDVDDPKYHAERTRSLLDKLHPTAIEIVDEKIETIIAHETEEDH
jgi:hypothetical protein